MASCFEENALRRGLAGAGPTSPDVHSRAGVESSPTGIVRPAATAVASMFWRGLDVLLDWQERSRQRHMLMGLDEHMLRDIGLTRAEAEAEFRKPPWRP